MRIARTDIQHPSLVGDGFHDVRVTVPYMGDIVINIQETVPLIIVQPHSFAAHNMKRIFVEQVSAGTQQTSTAFQLRRSGFFRSPWGWDQVFTFPIPTGSEIPPGDLCRIQGAPCRQIIPHTADISGDVFTVIREKVHPPGCDHVQHRQTGGDQIIQERQFASLKRQDFMVSRDDLYSNF